MKDNDDFLIPVEPTEIDLPERPIWYKLKDVQAVLDKMDFATWCVDWRVKYLDIRIDTRTMKCLVKDRHGKLIELEEIERIIKQANERY